MAELESKSKGEAAGEASPTASAEAQWGAPHTRHREQVGQFLHSTGEVAQCAAEGGNLALFFLPATHWVPTSAILLGRNLLNVT